MNGAVATLRAEHTLWDGRISPEGVGNDAGGCVEGVVELVEGCSPRFRPVAEGTLGGRAAAVTAAAHRCSESSIGTDI